VAIFVFDSTQNALQAIPAVSMPFVWVTLDFQLVAIIAANAAALDGVLSLCGGMCGIVGNCGRGNC